MACTDMSSSRQRAWSSSNSGATGWTSSMPAVSCTVSAVTAARAWQPSRAQLTASAGRPSAPDGSTGPIMRTRGGVTESKTGTTAKKG
ncbi:Uncharacterised protein [Bordetella pertussis]|nr:Uncharacterised protein [Bordetella pertussis]